MGDDSDDSDSDESDSESGSESETESLSEEEDESESVQQTKWTKKTQKKFEKDLDLLLNGNIDEYISKNMPMDIPAMSDKNDLSERPLVNRDELRPHSLSIQIKDVEMLQRKIGNVEHEPSDDDDLDNEEYKEEQVELPMADADIAHVAKSRNRRIDR